MTADEKKTWATLTSGADRVEFVDKFWEARNPNPGSPDNVFKTTFERRVAFADARFGRTEEKRGSLTDRGMVFVLLGPPTYGGRRPIRSGEDSSEAAGMSTFSSGSVAVALGSAAAASPSGKISSGQAAAIADRMTGPGSQAAESSNNYQEVWHYRKELLPKNVGYLQVDVTFVTKQGYGVDILQRDDPTLLTLAAAKKPARLRRIILRRFNDATVRGALDADPDRGGGRGGGDDSRALPEDEGAGQGREVDRRSRDDRGDRRRVGEAGQRERAAAARGAAGVLPRRLRGQRG